MRHAFRVHMCGSWCGAALSDIKSRQSLHLAARPPLCMCCQPSSPCSTLPGLTAADGQANGLLLLNSNGMDAVPSQDRVRFSIVGGVLDFFIFMGPTPSAVLEQLTRVVGRPAMPPYWSLGFHQCKYAAAVHYKAIGLVGAIVLGSCSALSVRIDGHHTCLHAVDLSLPGPRGAMQMCCTCNRTCCAASNAAGPSFLQLHACNMAELCRQVL